MYVFPTIRHFIKFQFHVTNFDIINIYTLTNVMIRIFHHYRFDTLGSGFHVYITHLKYFLLLKQVKLSGGFIDITINF